MPRLFTAVCATALIFTAASPSLAEETQSEIVRFGDLDLNDSYDAELLIARIHGAAGRVCGVRTTTQPLAQWDATRDCRTETTELAVLDVGHPVVTARYYGHTPRVIIEEGSYDPRHDDYVVVRKK